MELEKFVETASRIDINELINKAIKLNEKKILKLNTEEQLFKAGIRETGVKITPPYRPMTIRIKRKKGQPYDRVTLRDTGRWQSNIFIVYEKDQISFRAGTVSSSRSTNLTEILLNKYGKGVLGLTNLNIDILREIIEPTLLKLISQAYQ